MIDHLSGVSAVMVGRGAPIAVDLSRVQNRRVGADGGGADRGAPPPGLLHEGALRRRREGPKSWHFLPWHFDFLLRYRVCSQERFGGQSRDAPLIQTHAAARRRHTARAAAHKFQPERTRAARPALWDADSDAAAVDTLASFAESSDLQMLMRGETTEAGEVSELANIPSGDQKKVQRRRRQPAPQRTPEEIAQIRAERAAKRERTGAAPHVDGRARAEKDRKSEMM